MAAVRSLSCRLDRVPARDIPAIRMMLTASQAVQVSHAVLRWP